MIPGMAVCMVNRGPPLPPLRRGISPVHAFWTARMILKGLIAMETFDQQERRARRQLNLRAVIKASLAAGLITFILPGGGPWMSFDSGTATMGRVLTTNVVFAAAMHAASALAYGWVIALVTYSLSTVSGIILGALMSIPLFAASYLVVGGIDADANEVHAAIAHFAFALFFSAMYKAMAVPAPRESKA
jgi:hypothetical protein